MPIDSLINSPLGIPRFYSPETCSSSPMLRASQFAHTDKVEYLLTSSNSEAKHLSELRGLRFTIAFRNARCFFALGDNLDCSPKICTYGGIGVEA